MAFFNVEELLFSEDGNSSVDKIITSEVAAAALGVFFNLIN